MKKGNITNMPRSRATMRIWNKIQEEIKQNPDMQKGLELLNEIIVETCLFKEMIGGDIQG